MVFLPDCLTLSPEFYRRDQKLFNFGGVMKRTVQFCLLFPLIAASIQGAETFRNGLGIFGGMISGSGFSYRRMDDRFGCQFTFGILSSKGGNIDFTPSVTLPYDARYGKPTPSVLYTETRTGRSISGNAGINFYKPLHRTTKFCFYLLAGASCYFSTEKRYEQDYGYSNVADSSYTSGPVGERRSKRKTDATVFGGGGIGFEWKFSENLRFSLEWPILLSSDGDLIMYIPQGGMHYFFR
jgi:hypothetical protein